MMRKTKYFDVNYIMGEPALFNDKISTGRSLKWFTGNVTELVFKVRGPRLLQIPYVKNVKQGRGWIRVYV
jgi:hypothetical protein